MTGFNVDLSREVAVLTGGTGVLCSAMARALAASGAKVMVMSRRQAAVDELAAELRATGAEALGVSADVTDRDSLQAADEQLRAAFGPCTILVNGAGGNHPRGTAQKERVTAEDVAAADGQSFFDLAPEGFQHVFDVNYLGTVLATQVFARGMVDAGRGAVVNISSMSAFTPLTKVMSYSNAKSAVNSFTQWLAVHLAPTGIRVNAIAPGFFLTEQNRALLQSPDGTPTARGGVIKHHTPMGRYGEPEELLGTLLWLCSPAASGFVTGAIIPVDGGFSAFSGV